MSDYDAYDHGDDDYDPLDDDTPPKEEPDCYTCSDSGCPSCGYVDPQDPEHQQYLAKQIIQARVPRQLYIAPATEHEIGVAITGLPDVELTSLDAIRELVTTAIVTVTVQWPDPNATSEPLF